MMKSLFLTSNESDEEGIYVGVHMDIQQAHINRVYVIVHMDIQ